MAANMEAYPWYLILRLDTNQSCPRVGLDGPAGRVGSGHDFAGFWRVGSGQHFGFFSFSTDYFLVPESIESSNTTFVLIFFQRYLM